MEKEKENTKRPKLGSGASIFHFFQWADCRLLIPAFAITLVASLESPVVTILLGNIFDALSGFTSGKDDTDTFMNTVLSNAVGIISVGVATVVLQWLMVSLWCLYGDHQIKRARRQVFKSLVHKNMEWFDENTGVMGSLTMANRNIEDLRIGSSTCSAFTTRSVMIIVVSLALAFYRSWKLTLVSLAGLPVVVVIGALTAQPITKNLDRNKTYFHDASDTMHWTVGSIRTVKLFNSSHIHLESFNNDVTTAYKFYVRFCNFMALQQGLARFVVLAMFVQGFYYGNTLVQTGEISSGNVMTVFWCCIHVADAFHGLSPQIVLLRKAQAAVKSLLSLTETASEAARNLRQGIGIYPQNEPAGGVVLKDVNFTYPSRAGRVLRGVNMHIAPYQTTFIVGQSGSGKSTLSAILLKLYEIDTGHVFVDDMSLSTISTRWLFDNIHVVEQQAAMFDVSVAENISMGSCSASGGGPDDIDMDEVQVACEYGYLHDFMDRLEMNVGSGGEKLSGGQRQRVALARAYMARNAPIMILDESVSALDEPMRRKLMDSVRKFRHGKTTIVITHELAQIGQDDYVYLLHDGRVAQHGTRRKLEQSASGGHWQCMLEATEDFGRELEEDEQKVIPRHTIHSFHSRSSFIRPASIVGTGSMLLHGDLYAEDIDNEPCVGKEKEQKEQKKTLTRTLRQIYSTIPDKVLLYIGVTAAAVNGLINPLFSYAFSNLFSSIVPNSGTESAVMQWAMVVLGLAAADGVTTYMRVILDTASERWVKHLRQTYFAKMMRMDMPWQVNKNSAATSTQLAMSDTEAIRQLVTRLLSAVVCVIVLALVALIWAIGTGWKLALVGLSLMPGFYATSRWYTTVSTKWETRAQTNADDLVSLMNEMMASIRTVKVLALERYFVRQYTILEKEAMEIGFRKGIYTGLGFGVSQIFTYVTQGLLLWYGMKLISDGEYQVQQTMMVFTLLVFSLVTADQIFATIPQITPGLEAFTKLFAFLDMKIDPEEEQGDEPVPALTTNNNPAVGFRNVTFGYSPDAPVLTNVSFSIQQNETVGLVGPSGCGKSTTAALITRLYHPSGGIISINGQNINTLDANSIRHHVATVHQMPLQFLQHGSSIRQNLEYAFGEYPPHPQRRDASLFKALTQVGLYDFVSSLPDGLETSIGSGLMSGGQLQRLGVARALLTDPSILILDECTSALDPHSMAQIQKLVQELKSHRTIIIITHQQEMMNIADRLVTL